MTLPRSFRCCSFASLLSLGLSLGGCGDGKVEFSKLPLEAAGATSFAGQATGGASQGGTGSAGSAPLATGGTDGIGGSVPLTAAGSGNGGSGGAVTQPGAGGEDAAGGEAPGAGGSGGSSPEPQPTLRLDLIDDVEGTFPRLPSRDGRNGGWYSVHDATYGQAAPVSAVAFDRDASHFSAGFSGGGFTDWGAQMGISLKSPSAAYDASKYCGLRFLAKGSGAGWSVLVSDRLSVPQGGVCDTTNWDSDQGCYQFVGKKLAVSSVWQEVVIRFDELRLVRNSESARRLDSAAVYDIVFNFYDASGAGFDLLLDDLSFIEKGSLACQ